MIFPEWQNYEKISDFPVFPGLWAPCMLPQHVPMQHCIAFSPAMNWKIYNKLHKIRNIDIVEGNKLTTINAFINITAVSRKRLSLCFQDRQLVWSALLVMRRLTWKTLAELSRWTTTIHRNRMIRKNRIRRTVYRLRDDCAVYVVARERLSIVSWIIRLNICKKQ